MEKCKWRAGANFPVSANVANEAIKALQAALGKQTVTADELLDASRAADAPLHDCFEWDDTVAAEKFRRQQARQIISSIEVEIVHSEKKLQTRQFVSVTPLPARGEFAPIKVAMESKPYKEQILRNALIELRNFQRKYAVYSELSAVSIAINQFAASLKTREEN